MPRRQRVHLDDVPLYIVQRGHNREPCFFGDEDCFTYLHWLGEGLTETGGQLHAYALMTNYVHLLVTPHRSATVPKLIMSLGRCYVPYINTRSYRANTLGQTSPLFVPHPVYLSLGATDKARQAAYRHLFRYHLDEEMVSELRLAVNQNQPLGNERFYEAI